MLFKCGACTFVMDSKVHGNRPWTLCGEENPKRLPLDRWDVGYVDAKEYNSLFPPVADFRAAIGRPINDVDGGVLATKRQHARERIYVDLAPSSQTIVQATPLMATPLMGNKSAAATANSTDTSAPQKKKPPTLLPMVGGEWLTCSCATCTFLAERRLKMKWAADAEEK